MFISAQQHNTQNFAAHPAGSPLTIPARLSKIK